MNTDNNFISVGEIVNTHGIKGEVKVISLSDYPERFKTGNQLIAEKNGRLSKLTIDQVRTQRNVLLIKFREIVDMDAALEMKGAVLKIDKEQLPQLPDGTYYIFDIIGLAVSTEDGQPLGTVKDVIQTGSNDVFVVTGEAKEYMIPGLKEIVKLIDREKGIMIIRPLDGLLDL